MSELRGFTPSTYKSTTAEFTLGGLYTDPTTGYVYRYVKSVDNVAWVSGMIVEAGIKTTTTAAQHFICTVDRSGAGSSANRIPVGVVVCPLSASEANNGNYTFVLVDGFHAALYDSGNTCAKGNKIRSVTTVNGDGGATAAYTDHVVGTAQAAASGGFVAARVKVEF